MCGNKGTSKGRDPQPRILYIFDFDRTLVSENSEDIYNDFLDGETLRTLVANDELMNDWTSMCRAILVQLQNQDVKPDQILARVRLLQFVPGMDTLLQKVFLSTIQNSRNHLVILSGSNDLVIATVLATLNPPVFPNFIIANHLSYSPQINYLTFEPFNTNPVECPICPPPLCKGTAMENYIKEHGPFDLVYYTGDGGNDVCAATRLRKEDVLFIRSGYTLEAAVRAGVYNHFKVHVKAKIIYFEHPKTIESHMKIFEANDTPPGSCACSRFWCKR